MAISIQKAVSVLLLSSAALACGSKPPEPEAPPQPTEPAPAPPPEPVDSKRTDDPQKSTVRISDRIKEACGISERDAHFGYNSSQVNPAYRETLKKLATCFATGPLKGSTMHLVGHADPRGEPEYNMQLGEKRAGNVAKSIIAEGLPQAQVTTTSRGELDAHGTDEASWADDRTVDINVAE
jgi:peptidoglycan-associated lipoprotein